MLVELKVLLHDHSVSVSLHHVVRVNLNILRRVHRVSSIVGVYHLLHVRPRLESKLAVQFLVLLARSKVHDLLKGGPLVESAGRALKDGVCLHGVVDPLDLVSFEPQSLVGSSGRIEHLDELLESGRASGRGRGLWYGEVCEGGGAIKRE